MKSRRDDWILAAATKNEKLLTGFQRKRPLQFSWCLATYIKLLARPNEHKMNVCQSRGSGWHEELKISPNFANN